MKAIFFLMLMMVSFACFSLELEKVVVFSPDFSTRVEVVDISKLQLIEDGWITKEESPKTQYQSPLDVEFYKIDFFSDSSSMNGRWLYSPSGLIKILSKAPQKEYRIKDAQIFNQALGL